MIEFFEEIDGRGSHLIVAFTGVMQRMGGLSFEFYKSLGGVDAKVLFVRDTDQSWYQYDLATVDHVVRRIKATAAAVGANHLSCIGNSMGGFGALMFGGLCAADAILAFAPQTTILPQHTMSMGDHRWLKYQEKITIYSLPDLNALPVGRSHVTIHRGENDTLDAVHAERLNWPNRCVVHPGCGHNVAKALREQGDLAAAIRSGLLG
jgi:hypothetical protein